ncbi:hypothetical protein [Phyllobacterium lublinensis]|uniref:hypothetical protein n=1 Tax=Phyllobacterium lublinensis TaxID=2875708 RepID=UPI001CCD66A2|nr:hypothetical protein [Phyllobacterium sp. 2063]MBZ9654023.1 hypothetical protein [Phyllobacterium sp. 2063]
MFDDNHPFLAIALVFGIGLAPVWVGLLVARYNGAVLGLLYIGLMFLTYEEPLPIGQTLVLTALWLATLKYIRN